MMIQILQHAAAMAPALIAALLAGAYWFASARDPRKGLVKVRNRPHCGMGDRGTRHSS